MEMFKSLVVPIIMYASEVTGFSDSEQYERIQRRYVKWTLGLPRSTRNVVVQSESGCSPLSSMRLLRAVKYECSRTLKVSPLTREALREARASEKWASRRRRWHGLGWSVSEVAQRMDEPDFLEVVRRRECDQVEQVRLAEVSRVDWYVEPRSSPPAYLQKANKDMKTIARFRCGAETRSTEKWRSSDRCRMCGGAKETYQHITQCIGEEWYRWRKLCADDGRGIEWIRKILGARVKAHLQQNRGRD